jgi:hypothetical protein
MYLKYLNNIGMVMGYGCWVRKLKNPEPETQNPKPDFNWNEYSYEKVFKDRNIYRCL